MEVQVAPCRCRSVWYDAHKALFFTLVKMFLHRFSLSGSREKKGWEDIVGDDKKIHLWASAVKERISNSEDGVSAFKKDNE